MWYDFWDNKAHYKTEWLMLSYMGITTLILLTLLAISYFSFWRSDSTFLAKRGWWLVYLIITIVSTGGALWHFASHKTTFSTMTGMMIGMAIGMQSGVMLSVVIGSTNDVTSRKEKVERKPADFATFFSYCLIISTLFTVIIVYGYKSAFVA